MDILLPRQTGRKPSRMDRTTTSNKSSQTPTSSRPWKSGPRTLRDLLTVTLTLCMTLTLLSGVVSSTDNRNPHQLFKQTWVIRNGENYEEYNTTVCEAAALHQCFPELYFSLEHAWTDGGFQGPNAMRARATMRRNGFFTCPGYKTRKEGSKRCGGPAAYYCAEWSCVDSTDGCWKWNVTNELIRVEFAAPLKCSSRGVNYSPHMTLLKITFTDKGKQDERWTRGLNWGLMQYARPWHGLIFEILLRVEPLSELVGPNPVLRSPGRLGSRVPRSVKTQTQKPVMVQASTFPNPTIQASTFPNSTIQVTTSIHPMPSRSLESIMQAVYMALNHTAPNLTEACWLCFTASPPFYEAVGTNGSYTVNTTAPRGGWDPRPGIGMTMTQVTGMGLCVGNVPSNKNKLCAHTITTPGWNNSVWVTPDQGARWVCSRTGLTPHLAGSVFNQSQEFCLMIIIVPRIIYHPPEYLIQYWSSRTDRQYRSKREPITTMTIATLFRIGLAGAGTGIASLVTQNSGLSSLRAAVDEDLDRIEKSISHLEKSLSSLAEVVLQNRRGLDLMFLKNGGLCAALGEECCFYADHTGIVRDSMTKLRKGLEEQKEREAQESWYQSWFNQSPWFATLLSALAGPIVILLLIVTIGPWILNWLVGFIKDRINSVQLLVLRQQYQALPQDKPQHEDASSL